MGQKLLRLQKLLPLPQQNLRHLHKHLLDQVHLVLLQQGQKQGHKHLHSQLLKPEQQLKQDHRHQLKQER